MVGVVQQHPACSCILLVRQDRAEIIVDLRTSDGWSTCVLHADDELKLPQFGLVCLVRDVYRNTPFG